ncbi:MAG: M10 family metallopeptidase domain-containing protein [bacterium]|nr:M10 family metallopeptidase domain-containing protein [bacterium]
MYVLHKRAKGFSSILLLILLGSILFLTFQVNSGKVTLGSFTGIGGRVCNTPIKIELGEVDPRFKLSQQVILNELETASKVWEDGSDKDLFLFEGKGKSKVIVKFIYDNRQQEVIQSGEAKKELENEWSEYEKMVGERKILINEYENLKITYEKDKRSYDTRLNNYEERVKNWNQKQGTAEEYRALKKEEVVIESLYNKLEASRSAINRKGSAINNTNELIESLYNEVASKTNDYNRLFSSDEEITVGEYDGLFYINIYQYTNLEQLRITLAHELGHSLGMDHIENEKSIMYPLQSKQDGDVLFLTNEDKAELSRVCEK